jgi:hypothetical protein
MESLELKRGSQLIRGESFDDLYYHLPSFIERLKRFESKIFIVLDSYEYYLLPNKNLFISPDVNETYKNIGTALDSEIIFIMFFNKCSNCQNMSICKEHFGHIKLLRQMMAEYEQNKNVRILIITENYTALPLDVRLACRSIYDWKNKKLEKIL